MKNKSLLLAIAFMVFAISAQAQVKPVNKQKVVVKPVATAKGTFKDTRDGKTYKTVKIGTQTWMAENLAFKASSGCWAYDDSVTNVAKYGYLYNWETAKTVCPTGWHLPSDAEWKKLTTYLGGEDVAGEKMKSISDWKIYEGKSGNGTNTSGFAGLPGGYRYDYGTYSNFGDTGDWWTATESSTENSRTRYLYYDSGGVDSYYKDKRSGSSVRCLRDF
jgi:uncharacterized protein (TIGR02145 family)